MISFLEHKWITPDKEDVIELYLRSYMMQNKLHFTDNEYKTMIVFYLSGNCEKESTLKVMELNYFKSKQTVENCKSKLKKFNILSKENKFNYKVIPQIDSNLKTLLVIKTLLEPLPAKEDEVTN